VAGFALPMIAGVGIAAALSLLVACALLTWMARDRSLAGAAALGAEAAPGGRTACKSS